MYLHPSQIASLIENGSSEFKWRKPQSAKPIRGVDVNKKEREALILLGKMNFRGDAFNNYKHDLGCCGDCEQWRFENYFRMIEDILSVRRAVNEKGNLIPKNNLLSVVIGLTQMTKVMIKQFSYQGIEEFVTAIRIFREKVRKILPKNWN